MNNIDQLHEKLSQAITLLREAVDLSVWLKAQGSDSSRQVAGLWETFLGDFFSYVRKKSKETKQNLLAGIGFPRLR